MYKRIGGISTLPNYGFCKYFSIKELPECTANKLPFIVGDRFQKQVGEH